MSVAGMRKLSSSSFGFDPESNLLGPIWIQLLNSVPLGNLRERGFRPIPKILTKKNYDKVQHCRATVSNSPFLYSHRNHDEFDELFMRKELGRFASPRTFIHFLVICWTFKSKLVACYRVKALPPCSCSPLTLPHTCNYSLPAPSKLGPDAAGVIRSAEVSGTFASSKQWAMTLGLPP